MNRHKNNRDARTCSTGKAKLGVCSRALGTVVCVGIVVWASQAVAASVAQPESAGSVRHFDITEYRVDGAHKLAPVDVETAVYPFLGPYRTTDDVEKARAALEKAYHDKGYLAASVVIPSQKVEGGLIVLQVYEGEVGRLRVRGARYYSPSEIKAIAPSLAEGNILESESVKHDLVGLNQFSDRRVTPTLKPGMAPGLVDVDLEVKDSLPLHGSVEFNNQYSANTKQFRVVGSASYNNLWQLGHVFGFTYQTAPENTTDAQVFSAYYQAPVPGVEWLNLMLQGTKNDSNISSPSFGGYDTVGKGASIGPRAIISLPGAENFFQSITLGVDYKYSANNSSFGGIADPNPSSALVYYPFSGAYTAGWSGKGYDTLFNSTITLNLRGLGSSEQHIDSNRSYADGNFIYLRSNLSHTQDLPEECQIFGKMQGQVASGPLIGGEELSAGGLNTVRGYLEGEDSGDDGVLGTVELRSPSLTALLGKKVDEWRFYLFGDAGIVLLHDPLPEQDRHFDLASMGIGSRLRFQDHYNGSFDLGVPMIDGTYTSEYTPRLTFRLWAEF